MGYNTRFELTVFPAYLRDDFLDNLTCPDSVSYAIKSLLEYGPDEFKWYTWKKDMLDFSKQYPKLLFMLRGQGEDSEDVWMAWFRVGKCSYRTGKITFAPPPPEFSPNPFMKTFPK